MVAAMWMKRASALEKQGNKTSHTESKDRFLGQAEIRAGGICAVHE